MRLPHSGDAVVTGESERPPHGPPGLIGISPGGTLRAFPVLERMGRRHGPSVVRHDGTDDGSRPQPRVPGLLLGSRGAGKPAIVRRAEVCPQAPTGCQRQVHLVRGARNERPACPFAVGPDLDGRLAVAARRALRPVDRRRVDARTGDAGRDPGRPAQGGPSSQAGPGPRAVRGAPQDAGSRAPPAPVRPARGRSCRRRRAVSRAARRAPGGGGSRGRAKPATGTQAGCPRAFSVGGVLAVSW